MGLFGTFPENLEHCRDILFELLSPCPDRGQCLLKHRKQELLDFHVTETASPVVVLHFLKVRIVRCVCGEMLRSGECVKIGEYCIALDFTRVADLEVAWVREHSHHLLLEVFRAV